VALIIDVLFTYPLILTTVHEVLESTVFFYNLPKDKGSDFLMEDQKKNIQRRGKFPIEFSLLKRNVLRTGVVCLVWAMAAAIPNVSGLLGIISGIAITFNAFILGPLVHLKLTYDEAHSSYFKKISWLVTLILHVMIILFGAGIGIWATYLSVQSVIKDYSR